MAASWAIAHSGPGPLRQQIKQLLGVLNQVPGVVENGLFIDICDRVVIGFGDGRVEVRDINEGTIEHDRVDLAENDNLFTDLAD